MANRNPLTPQEFQFYLNNCFTHGQENFKLPSLIQVIIIHKLLNRKRRIIRIGKYCVIDVHSEQVIGSLFKHNIITSQESFFCDTRIEPLIKNQQSVVSIHGPLCYGPSTLPLRHSALITIKCLFGYISSPHQITLLLTVFRNNKRLANCYDIKLGIISQDRYVLPGTSELLFQTNVQLSMKNNMTKVLKFPKLT